MEHEGLQWQHKSCENWSKCPSVYSLFPHLCYIYLSSFQPYIHLSTIYLSISYISFLPSFPSYTDEISNLLVVLNLFEFVSEAEELQDNFASFIASIQSHLPLIWPKTTTPLNDTKPVQPVS